MKKISLLFALITLLICCKSASSSSSLFTKIKYNEAIITYNDGNVKKGYAEMVDISYKNVKFRSTENGDTEILADDNIKKIEYVDQDGNKFLAEKLYHNKDKGEKGVKKGERIWLYVLYSNGIKLVANRSISTFKYNAVNGTSSGTGGSTTIFIGKEKEDGVFYLYDLMDQISVNVGLNKYVRKNCEFLFKDCPEFIQAVNAENFKKDTVVNRLIELYEDSGCNKSAATKLKPKSASKKKSRK